MKIFHLINTLSTGGAELHLLTLCGAQKRQGLEPVVAYFKEHVQGSRSLRRDFEALGIPVFPLQADSAYDFRFLSYLRSLTKVITHDILHTHLPRADLAGWLVRIAGLHIPWIVSIHDIYSRSWNGRWILPWFTYIWRQADAMIAISHAVKNWLVKARGISENAIYVVHYGIHVERFYIPKRNLRPHMSKGKSPVIGTIGRLEPRKGHDLLIRAMPYVLERFSNAVLIIAGHDPWHYGPTLRRLIKGQGLEGSVQLVGFQEDIPSFLHALDLFAFASRSEGFGQVVIEAMAAGKPVVVSRIAPFTEIVLHGETGLLVERTPEAFAQAIIALLEDPERAQDMGKKARQRVREVFSVKIMAQKTLDVYKRVLSTAA